MFHPAAFGVGATEAVTESGATTVNVAGALAPTPVTLTTTDAGPTGTPCGTGTAMLVLLHEVGVADKPAKVMVLEPCVLPKWEPVMVTLVPTGPAVGERLEMDGTTISGGRTSTTLRL